MVQFAGLTVYEGDCAEEEVGEEDPVDNGGPHDGQDGEDGCCDASPGTQEQPAQISELWYVVGLAVDIIGPTLTLMTNVVNSAFKLYKH